MRELDLPYVRARFPALGDEWALCDNAGGSVPLDAVVDAVRDYMSRWQVNLGASYGPSARATALVQDGVRAMATLVGCEEDEVVLGGSSTMLVRLLASGLAPAFAPGDEIVVTNLDHESNVAPWRELADRGVVIREWRFDPESLELTAAGLDALLGPRTRLVAFTQVSNLFGTVHDAAALVRRIQAAGAMACVDAVAYAPHRFVDVRALGADFLFLSLYKLSGPHEGLLYARRDRLRATRSLAFPFLGDDLGPYRLQPGNVNHELTASLPALLAYYLDLGRRQAGDPALEPRAALAAAFAAIEAHEARLAQPLLDFLARRRGVRLLGRETMDARRVPTISFTVDGKDSRAIVEALDKEKIGTRFGHFYSYRAAEALGILGQNGVVRISLFHYNAPAEIERVIATLGKIL